MLAVFLACGTTVVCKNVVTGSSLKLAGHTRTINSVAKILGPAIPTHKLKNPSSPLSPLLRYLFQYN
ncbi:hypothetical protein CROQUDRAFT_100647 [Cronartium quercuum f. sp. fusiforme G11]|uniref:Uncharacterized protein n=1 Tax=Cronartium quercuum f. sp. fusiforme G11 TaxID=708437 RepID=A0A9P6T5M9_9BASI|nr:hypothetical protein CROQUDRAFT_100647 [Cronartium quercuum f. sp. fusiforme G11]